MCKNLKFQSNFVNLIPQIFVYLSAAYFQFLKFSDGKLYFGSKLYFN